MTRLICTLMAGLLFSGNILPAQDLIENYVREHAVPIRSIDPDAVDFADLEAIGAAIGDRRVVMLGEQDHGDAPAFLAKTRLIKYLHEKKGFTVLAFESDFFGLNEGWDHLNKTNPEIDSFLRRNIFGIWTMCDACAPLLYEYIPETYQKQHPLTITGFDNQLILGYSDRHLFPKLDSVLRSRRLPVTQLPEYAQDILPAISNWYKYEKDNAAQTRCIRYLETIETELAAVAPVDDFWLLVIQNLIQVNIQYKNRYTDYYTSHNARDVQMARNLKWLYDIKYPAEKIIVWAHNFHISKYAGHYPQDFLNKMNTMGDVFTSDSMRLKDTYILGFTSLEGRAGRIGQKEYKINKPKSKSFERWIHPECEYAFVDFQEYNAANPAVQDWFYMSGAILGNGRHTNHQAHWNRIFDGVFYIKKMYPCKR